MEYIKPELLILIPVLNVAGKVLKSSAIPDKHIPLILTVISMISACLCIIGYGGDNIFSALLGGIVQGVLCAGTAVYGNQLVKQYTKTEDVKNDNDGEG